MGGTLYRECSAIWDVDHDSLHKHLQHANAGLATAAATHTQGEMELPTWLNCKSLLTFSTTATLLFGLPGRVNIPLPPC